MAAEPAPVEPDMVELVDGVALPVPEVLEEPRSLEVLVAAPVPEGLVLVLSIAPPPVADEAPVPDAPEGLDVASEVPDVPRFEPLIVEPLVLLVAGSAAVVPVAPVFRLPLLVPVVVPVVPVLVLEVPLLDASVPEVWADTPMAVTRAAAAATRVKLVGSFDM